MMTLLVYVQVIMLYDLSYINEEFCFYFNNINFSLCSVILCFW